MSDRSGEKGGEEKTHLVNALVRDPVGVNDLAECRREYSVEDDIGRVKECHDGSEGGDVVRLEVPGVEGALDVGSERDVTSGPCRRWRSSQH